MKTDKTRLIYWLLGLVTVLAGSIYAITWSRTQAETETNRGDIVNLKLQLSNQYGAIDSRLSRIEERLGVQTSKKVNVATSTPIANINL